MEEKVKSNILVIADTHYVSVDEFNKVIDKDKLQSYDGIISLGDVHISLSKYINDNCNCPFIGVLGNHDLIRDRYKTFYNTHMNLINIWGIDILGFEGSYRYKETNDYPLYTDEESIKMLSEFYQDEVDILISHDSINDRDRFENKNHNGLEGINEFLKNNKYCKYNIHGHFHKNMNRKFYEKDIICVYGLSEMILNVENDTLKNIEIKNIYTPD